MNKDEKIITEIWNATEYQENSDSHFLSNKDKAYRCEALREMFCGLERENQNKVLKLITETFIKQNGIIKKNTL